MSHIVVIASNFQHVFVRLFVAKRDGWNMYGQLNSDGTPCKANCRQYLDPTGGVIPFAERRANEFKFRGSIKKLEAIEWQPLLEDNGRGYFVKQLHVTPHIGRIAQTAVLTREDFESRTSAFPDYDYETEARLVLERMSTLNDAK